MMMQECQGWLWYGWAQLDNLQAESFQRCFTIPEFPIQLISQTSKLMGYFPNEPLLQLCTTGADAEICDPKNAKQAAAMAGQQVMECWQCSYNSS